MICRERHLTQIALGLRQFPVVALLGPRQVGKTTLARQLAAQWDGPTHQSGRPGRPGTLERPRLCIAPADGSGGAR